MTKTLIDPPSGWQFGFPKEFPDELKDSNDEELGSWLVENGYPQRLVDKGYVKYCRFLYFREDE